MLNAGPCLAADIITYDPACLKQAPYMLEVVSIPPVFANRVSVCMAACYLHSVDVGFQRADMVCCLHNWFWGPRVSYCFCTFTGLRAEHAPCCALKALHSRLCHASAYSHQDNHIRRCLHKWC